MKKSAKVQQAEVDAGGTLTKRPERELSEFPQVLREPDSAELNRVATLESALDATADALLVLDLNNNVVAVNRYFSALFCLGPESTVLPLTTTGLVRRIAPTAKDPEKFVELMQQCVEYPDEVALDTILLKDGRVLERHSRANVVDGETVGCVLSFRDISGRVRSEATLRESEARYRMLFDRNPSPIWVYDLADLRFLAVNDAAIRKYGYTRKEFLNLTVKDVRPEEDIPAFLDVFASTALRDTVVKTGRHQTKDGSIIDVEVAAQSIVYGGREARMALITDLTEQKKAEAALRESEYRLRTLLDSMSEGLLQVDPDDNILYVNDSICRMTGYSQIELIGRNWAELIVDDGPGLVSDINERRLKGLSDRYEIRIRKKSGEVIWVIVGGAPVIDADGQVTGSMGVFTDITERKRSEERLRHDALHDGLTGLANRTLFMDHLRTTIQRSSRNKRPFAVLYLDFDRFKVINDSLGHAEGDRLLKFIARRLENCTRTGDLVARLGGDEFVILLSELVDTGEALLVAERIQSDLKLSFDLGGREIFTTTSIGIALSTSGHTNAEDMLRDADIAMYYAKAKGKAQYQIFDQGMLRRASKKLQIETEMRLALARGDFQIHYQPIVALKTGRLVGFEALLRWVHDERGIILPDEFIPIAEETGMILKLGSWVVEESCRQLHEWHTTEPLAEGLTMSVNLSSKEFLQPDLVDRIAGTLRATGLSARFLKVEITESHIMENSELAVKVINDLRSLGIEMSLDDFGTGYSSLSYLHKLPVTSLKIDRSFVGRMTRSEENREIVNTIVRLAQNLKMKVVAEGIESMEQLTELTAMSCELGQGFLIASPLEAGIAKQFIVEHGLSNGLATALTSAAPPEMAVR